MSASTSDLHFAAVESSFKATPIKGAITEAGPFDLGVEITAPFSGWHIYRRVGRVWREPVQWFEPEQIEPLAQELLTVLYHVGTLVTKRRPRLVDAYIQLRHHFEQAWLEQRHTHRSHEQDLLNQRAKGWAHALYLDRQRGTRSEGVKQPLADLNERYQELQHRFIDDYLPELLPSYAGGNINIAKMLADSELRNIRQQVFRRLARWAVVPASQEGLR